MTTAMSTATTEPRSGAQPARRLRADARRNRERLLVAARAQLTAEGPEAALDDIARAAGVGIGTLYRHFPTRDQLLEAVLQDAFDELEAEAGALLDSPDPGAALVDWLRANVRHAMSYKSLAATVMLCQLGEDSPPCERARLAGDRLLQRAQASGEVRADVEIDDVLRLVNAVALAVEDSPDPEERGARLLDLVLDGMRR
jgi:AcrR family transcriptional regulator